MIGIWNDLPKPMLLVLDQFAERPPLAALEQRAKPKNRGGVAEITNPKMNTHPLALSAVLLATRAFLTPEPGTKKRC